jgi:deoxyribonuclease-4
MSIAGGHHLAVRAAHAVGFRCVQVFTKSANQWKAKALDDALVAEFRKALAETGIADPVAHNSYLINLGSPDDALWKKSIDAMTLELERAEMLGIADLVTHPGAHCGSGERKGLRRIARALNEVHRRAKGFHTRIDLETTAGQGSCLGDKFEHLGRIIELVKEPERLGVCVDTCHIFAAGYPLGNTEQYNATIEELDRSVGLSRVRVWHLNDSRRELGSRVDRHAAIGAGHLGLSPFRFVVNDPRFAHVPMVLETPKGIEHGEDLDARNLRTLLGLLSDAGLSSADSPRRSTTKSAGGDSHARRIPNQRRKRPSTDS